MLLQHLHLGLLQQLHLPLMKLLTELSRQILLALLLQLSLQERLDQLQVSEAVSYALTRKQKSVALWAVVHGALGGQGVGADHADWAVAGVAVHQAAVGAASAATAASRQPHLRAWQVGALQTLHLSVQQLVHRVPPAV